MDALSPLQWPFTRKYDIIKNLGWGGGGREKNYSLYVKDFKWILYEYELIWLTNNYQKDTNSNILT